MQMFGIGVLELMVILTVAVLIVGPERLPQVAADLARWIRTARAMGQKLTREFDDTWKEFQKEAGTTSEDWKEIQSVFMRNSREITGAVEKAVADVEEAANAANAGNEAAAGAAITTRPRPPQLPPAGEATNVVPFDSTARGVAESPDEGEPVREQTSEEADKPWYMPDTPTRRRRQGD